MKEVKVQEAVMAMTTLKYFVDCYHNVEMIVDTQIPREDFQWFSNQIKDKPELTSANSVMKICIDTLKQYIQENKKEG